MRNTWIRRISAIRKDGVESAINLTCGLNCVIGASNTGKTRIAKTVEFVCGGKETPLVVPEFLRTLVFARPRGDDQFADCTFSPSLDMSR